MSDGNGPHSSSTTELKLQSIERNSKNTLKSASQPDVPTSRESITVVKERKEGYTDRPQRVRARRRKNRRPKEDYTIEAGAEENNETKTEINNAAKIQTIARPPRTKKYEYLDHTADIQVHSWGDDMIEALENSAIGMFGYMTELDKVEFRTEFPFSVKANTLDMESMFFRFLDELLVIFFVEGYLLFRDVKITSFDRENWEIHGVGYGEVMDLSRHPQGTEVKAITYSAMQIYEEDNKVELYVVLDI